MLGDIKRGLSLFFLALKTVIEMPDADADRIIRSLKQENWAISNKLRKAYPQLFQEDGPWFDLHAPIIQAVRAAFEGSSSFRVEFDSENPS